MTQIPSKSAATPSGLASPQTPGSTDTRLLLRRMRGVMAGPGTAAARLDQIVRLIATTMVAEVCSIYLRRAGEVLELFATQGLNPNAVHQTRLRVGEGVIGDIAARARAVALADARAHPSFAYRPETGEEEYHSMMGVPILRSGKVIGVVAVQNRTQRHYTDDEVETLQTIAMVTAEMVSGAQLVSAEELRQTDGNALLPLRLDGVKLHGGPALGIAVLHRSRPVVRKVIAEDIALELERLNSALEGMHSALDALLEDKALAGKGEHRDVLETYRMIAEDRGWLGRIREAIGGGLTAEAAVQKVQNETNARMAQIQDPYLRERIADFQDLANRLMSHLAGTANGDDHQNGNGHPPPHMIVVAETMGPAELLDYDRSRLRGVVLASGSPTSHVAIVARALDIPVVGRVADILDRIEPGDPIIVDGDNAQVFLRPGDDVQTSFLDSVLDRSRRRAAYQALRSLPARTLDGTDISLQINAGLLVDLGHLEDTGADGVGLYRTEIPFMVRPDFPDVVEQTELYRRIVEHSDGKSVVFRTLDIGGDKLLPYVQEGGEENPAMGWRAIRIALDRPAILRQQLRALIAASAGRPLQVMFPMIAEVAEFRAARRLLEMELDRAKRNEAEPPSTVEIGVMLEVPALAYQLPILAEEADFISVGSNDLLQFLFASDRGNPRLAQRYEALAPPVIALLRSIAETCRSARGGAGTRLSLCGEMAGNPLEAMALIGLGFRNLSMAAPSIGPVKEMVRSLDVPRLTEYLDSLAQSADHSLRPKLTAFARDHGVVI